MNKQQTIRAELGQRQLFEVRRNPSAMPPAPRTDSFPAML